MALSPYLSYETLCEVVECGLFSKGTLKKIIKANPQLIQIPDFMDFLDNSTIPFSSQDKESFISSLEVNLQKGKKEFQRTKLEAELARLEQERYYYAGLVIRRITTDSGGLDYDSLATWISNRSGLNSAYELVELSWQQNLWEDALKQIVEIPNNYKLSKYQEAEYQTYKELKELLHEAHKNKRSLAELEATEVGQLRQFAVSNTGRGSASAKNILNFFYGFRMWSYPLLPEKLDDASPRSKEIEEEEKTNSLLKIAVYPNPSSNWVLFHYQLPHESKQAQLAILSLNGQELHRFDLKASQGQLEWDTSTLPAGIYFYQIQTDSGDTEVNKLIIYK
ncbi:MAG: T9SS type A sorting domain-containing protein [Aureispira sp.]|nr:T9SS type A sorting domain-containing protein [Aureispira sp.]